MADGYGDPNNSKLFASHTEVLYSLTYTLKFMIKKKDEKNDYAVPPLEGLWWMGNNDYFDEAKKDEWKWTIMIAQPKVVTDAFFMEAREAVKNKKGIDTSAVRFEAMREGLSVQLLHIGPYSAEGPNIKQMHTHMAEKGYTFNGKHHEIYLGDPRKSAPEKLKTILRQPIKKI